MLRTGIGLEQRALEFVLNATELINRNDHRWRTNQVEQPIAGFESMYSLVHRNTPSRSSIPQYMLRLVWFTMPEICVIGLLPVDGFYVHPLGTSVYKATGP